MAECGRPSTYNEEIGVRICQGIAEGKSIRAICAGEGMPAISTVFLWLQAHKEFSEHYTRAREVQAELMADDIVSIADGSDGQDHNRDRLRVDARKWVAAKLLPKKYGDRVTTEHAGSGGGPIQIVMAPDLDGLA